VRPRIFCTCCRFQSHEVSRKCQGNVWGEENVHEEMSICRWQCQFPGVLVSSTVIVVVDVVYYTYNGQSEKNRHLNIYGSRRKEWSVWGGGDAGFIEWTGCGMSRLRLEPKTTMARDNCGSICLQSGDNEMAGVCRYREDREDGCGGDICRRRHRDSGGCRQGGVKQARD